MNNSFNQWKFTIGDTIRKTKLMVGFGNAIYFIIKMKIEKDKGNFDGTKSRHTPLRNLSLFFNISLMMIEICIFTRNIIYAFITLPFL